MNTDQITTMLKTLKTLAAPGAWEQALSALSEPQPAPVTPAKVEEAASVPGAPEKAKAKRVISEEQKAKMKAGREAAKAKKDAEKEASAKRHLKFDDEPAPEPAAPAPAPAAPAAPAEKKKRVLSEEQKAKMKAGREAAKAKKDAEKQQKAAEEKGELQALVDTADRGEAARERIAVITAAKPAPAVVRCAECHKNLDGGFDHRMCFFGGNGGAGYESETAWMEAARAYTATLAA